MIQVRIGAGCGPTGRILQNLIEQMAPRGAQGVVNWGQGGADGLNRHVGRFNKFQQFGVLYVAGVRVPAFFEHPRGNVLHFPYFGRKFNHVAGKDITLVLQHEDFAMRRQAGAQFFTEYVPSSHEYRVWVFRDKHLGTYEKVLTHPEQYLKVGRNHGNGFGFRLVNRDVVPRNAVDAAKAAVRALELDFGAVDILEGKDGKFYVLEVNTAPGVEGDGRVVIQALARNIVEWAGGNIADRPRRAVAPRPVAAARRKLGFGGFLRGR
jgi:hypothetical protein